MFKFQLMDNIKMSANTSLFFDFSTIPAIGAKRKDFFARLVNGSRVFDVLAHLPSGILQRRYVHDLTSKDQDCLVTFHFQVNAHHPNARRGIPYRISGMLTDSETPVDLLFFNPYKSFLERAAKQNDTIIVSGKLSLSKYKGAEQYQIIHPDHMGAVDSLGNWVGIERVYPLTAGLTQGIVRTAVDSICSTLMDAPEWLSAETLRDFKLPTWKGAFLAVHYPQTDNDLHPMAPGRQRLAYDELFAKQIAQHYYHALSIRHAKTPILPYTSALLQQFLATLPFKPTGDQERAIHDIARDLTQETPMHRLLQGDVGSGKTLVALGAAMIAIENGFQVAILAPTDILARQHLTTIRSFVQGLGIRVELLTGREKGAARARILNDLQCHTIHIMVGTHALFQADVIYAKLGLAVIDEQHRFGVKQRLELTQKANQLHVLSMTATPIPRTLLLAHYGEMAVSLLKEKPPGRKEIETRTINLDRLEDVLTFVANVISRGEKVFWVCPLVEESEKLDLAAATDRYSDLAKHFGDVVVLTHGRQKADEKQNAMQRFAKEDAMVLVSTTVIEVGVDVPEATVMIIECAERFGLAQLHQLRGRIGRGELKGTCLLLFGDKISFVARQRLQMMKKTTDGFELAEADLRLRGGGDTLGVRQSGLPMFRFADMASEDPDVYQHYQYLYEHANDEAKELLRYDPHLTTERGMAVQFLLRLFNLDEAEQLKRAG